MVIPVHLANLDSPPYISILSVVPFPRYGKGMEETPELLPEETTEPLEEGDPTAHLDLETVFEGVGSDGEMEALSVQNLLTAAGIEAVLVGSSSLPTFPFELRVPHEFAAEARRVIEVAKAMGPASAEAEERATEGTAVPE